MESRAGAPHADPSRATCDAPEGPRALVADRRWRRLAGHFGVVVVLVSSGCYVGNPLLSPRLDAASVDAASESGCVSPGHERCAGAVCRDLQSDPANCGACGRTCGEGEQCVRGFCACRVRGQTYCDGVGCRNLRGDPEHCGSCNARCPINGLCNDGVCRCPEQHTECARRCVDLSGDGDHCGGCDRSCARTVANAALACDGARCVGSPRCVLGYGDCDGVPSNGCEVDLRDNNAHCGVCGRACAAGLACAEGTCDVPCPAGLSRCGGACRDLRDDPDHCGACGVSCGRGRCVASLCVCDVGATLCPSVGCVDLSASAEHCSACQRRCSPGNVCVRGACRCPRPTERDCNGEPCRDLASDPRHCGACGLRCDSGASCVDGVCVGASPRDAGLDGEVSADIVHPADAVSPDDRSPGDVRCAGPGELACGGACVDVSSDRLHCGSCGGVCPEGSDCVAGRCVATRCGPGLTRCGDGCRDLLADPRHCGACGRVCSFADGFARCAGGVCALSACRADFADCDRSPTNGCETDLRGPANCGLCGRACTGRQVCFAGSCACPSNLVRCGGHCVDPRADAAHCGVCGRACPAPRRCVSGACLEP